LREWSCGPVPELVERRVGRAVQRLFPALHDDGGSVSCRLFPTPEAASRAGRQGVLRLLMLAQPQQYRALLQRARSDRSLVLRGRGLAEGGDMAEDAVQLAFAAVFLPQGTPVPHDQATFRSVLDQGRTQIVPAGEQWLQRIKEVLELRDAVVERLSSGLTGPGAGEAAADIGGQLDSLVFPGFLAVTPPERLAATPRYLRATMMRMDRLALGKGEARQVLDLAPHRKRLREGMAVTWSGAAAAEAFRQFRWMVEEFRVSLFAQQLGAGEKVSHARLETQWRRVRELQAGLD
jgi:ATP-dependent helicase HrpA